MLQKVILRCKLSNPIMKQPSQIIRFTASILLSLYIGGLVGVITTGVVHGIEHMLAEHLLSSMEASASQALKFKEAGCKPADFASNDSDKCPGCTRQQKRGAAMVKYAHVFGFYGCPKIVPQYVKQDAEYLLNYLDQTDQISTRPLTPPPQSLTS